MLTLGRQNDDSLARDLEWVLSTEQTEITAASVWVLDDEETIRRRRVRVIEDIDSSTPPESDDSEIQTGPVAFADLDDLPEINPHVSVRDEDSFAKPVPLPEINPHVSVRDEDSFAKPVALPEIDPHVSVRDEDSFAKPVALPEIDPHVSVRDEDSFAKPVPLPAINPHVSVRDEDSFAKPLPLPEINPHVSIDDDAQLFSAESQISRNVPSVEEPQPPAGEPAYVTVSLDGRKEKTFVQEYMGLSSSRSVMSSSVQDEPRAFEPIEDELRPLVSSRVQKSEEPRPIQKPKVHHDEKQSRLIVNFPVQDKPPAVTPPVQDKSLAVTHSVQNKPRAVTPPVQNEPQPVVATRVKVLDESQVLPGEASFATAIPNESFGGHAHSPFQEFQAKTNLSLKTFLLASLLFVSILGVSALVILEATTGIFTSPQVASSSESKQPEPTGPEVLSSSKAVPPVTPRPKQESQAMAQPREYPKFPNNDDKPSSIRRSTSELSDKTNSNDLRAETTERKSDKTKSREIATRQTNKNAGSSRNARANVPDRARGNKVADGKRPNVKAQPKKVRTAAAPAPARESATAKSKGEKSSTPSNGANGAQRPRTVTRSASPGE